MTSAILLIIIYIGLGAIGFFIIIAIMRAVFSIGRIVELLEQIAKQGEKPMPPLNIPSAPQ
jgi:hypothetical protein